MSRLTFDDLTPDDMPAPYVDDSGDRADAYRDSLLDCGKQTTEVTGMNSTDANSFSVRRLAYLREKIARLWGDRFGSGYGAHARCEIRFAVRELRQRTGKVRAVLS